MAGNIIPRREWRTFGKCFGVSEKKIRSYEPDNFKKSSKKYTLSANSNENCKVHDEVMGINSL